MATIKLYTNLALLTFTFILATFFVKGVATPIKLPQQQEASHSSPLQKELNFQQGASEDNVWRKHNSRRLMIGSTAPICTYNECRGCKYKCKAEQIPVDANDPINSAYHYRCVCHR